MEKKKYYVSVQAGTALEDIGASGFEFEIMATPQQLDELERLFQEKDNAENPTFVRGLTPGIPYHQDAVNDEYDDVLLRVYSMIYELGTPETKEHIRQMNVLNNRETAQDDPMPLH